MSLQPSTFRATPVTPMNAKTTGEGRTICLRFSPAYAGREFATAFRPFVAPVDLGCRWADQHLLAHLGTARGGGVLGGADIGKGLRARRRLASPIERCDPP